MFYICPGKRVGTFLRTSQKHQEGQFLASELVSNKDFFEFFSKVFVNRGARVSLGSKSRELQRIFAHSAHALTNVPLKLKHHA